MKQITTALLLLITFTVNAQKKSIEIKHDTLYITDLNAVKVIKIGDNFYRVASPTIQKVEADQSQRYLPMIGRGNIIYDTSGFNSLKWPVFLDHSLGTQIPFDAISIQYETLPPQVDTLKLTIAPILKNKR